MIRATHPGPLQLDDMDAFFAEHWRKMADDPHLSPDRRAIALEKAAEYERRLPINRETKTTR